MKAYMGLNNNFFHIYSQNVVFVPWIWQLLSDVPSSGNIRRDVMQKNLLYHSL